MGASLDKMEVQEPLMPLLFVSKALITLDQPSEITDSIVLNLRCRKALTILTDTTIRVFVENF